MKWFKHYSNASTNRFLQSILSQKNGLELYAQYFLLLEFLCEDFTHNKIKFIVHNDQLKKIFRVKFDEKLRKICETFRNFSAKVDQELLDFSELSDNFWEIKTPIILELMGKDFKYTRAKRVHNDAKNKNKNKNKEKEIKNIKKAPDEIFEIISCWNAQKIIVHKIDDKLISEVVKLRKRKINLAASEIIKAIENYKFILSNENFLWTHKWSLKEFLQRENAEKFFPSEFDVERFPTLNNQKITTTEEIEKNLKRKENWARGVFDEC